MKNLKKILAILLTALFVLSATTVLAGAVSPERANLTRHSSKNDGGTGDDFEITQVFTLGEDQFLSTDAILDYVDIDGANDYYFYSLYQNTDVYDDDATLIGFDSSSGNCVDLISVDGFCIEYDSDSDDYYYYYMGTQYFLIVVNTDGEDMGEVTGVSLIDTTFNYKADNAWLYNWVETASEDGAYWIEFYITDGEDGTPIVYYDGYVDTTSTGESHVTCYVIDANGNVFTDSCTVTVKLTFLQWIIKYLCFGWLWGF